MLENWLPFLVWGILAFVIPASMVLFTFLFSHRPSRRSRARSLPFESGVSLGPPRQHRFTISFYLTAMLFIVFDIEIVFLYPLAMLLADVGWFALGAFAFFVAMLIIPFAYDWKKGALEWH